MSSQAEKAVLRRKLRFELELINVEAALIAFQNIAALERMTFLFGGVLMGLALGAMPGLGGLVGLAILLPFTFDMDPYAAFAVMIGLIVGVFHVILSVPWPEGVFPQAEQLILRGVESFM